MAQQPTSPTLPGQINAIDSPELFESIKLAGVWSPGICIFPQAPKRITGWDIQVPSGGGGGFTIQHKIPPITWTIQFKIWKGDDGEGGDVDHFPAWEAFKKLFSKAIKRNDPHALSIWHPLLAGLNPPVTDCVIANWGDPLPVGDGMCIAEVVFDEYRPFIIKPVKPLIGTSTAKDDPNAERKAKVALAVTEYQDPGTLTSAQRQKIGLNP